jgi:acid phosphatase (class A)
MRSRALFGLAIALLACSSRMMTWTASAQPRSQSPLGEGYLSPDERPDSLALVPMPPAEGSAAMSRDQAASDEALALEGKPRWQLARLDAELRLPQAAQAFSCATGVKLDADGTPRLMKLLSRSASDLAFASSRAKNRYRRPRPFMTNGRQSCTPEREPLLRQDGSYPSGHAAIGWGWGLILAELIPDRADAILARGRGFGDSRVVCNVHWLSDVEEGRILGAATVAKLHTKSEFRNDLEGARTELATLKVKQPANTATCAAEQVLK